MSHIVVLRRGGIEKAEQLYTPPDEEPSLKSILAITRENFKGWVLVEWLVG
jgi:hypothetical protein